MLRKRTKLEQDRLAARFVWNGRGLAEQLQQFGTVLTRQQIESQREHLSELYPGSSQVLEERRRRTSGRTVAFPGRSLGRI
jgi:hypothetical protein